MSCYDWMRKKFRDNMELIVVIVLSLIAAWYFSFVFIINGVEINFYDRMSEMIIGLLGFIIASYTLFVGFVLKLKPKVGKDTLSQLNKYFIFTLALLLVTNVFYVTYPIYIYADVFLFRFLYIFTLGTTVLMMYYLYLCADKFIQ